MKTRRYQLREQKEERVGIIIKQKNKKKPILLTTVFLGQIDLMNTR
jgi:hypothetical protein